MANRGDTYTHPYYYGRGGPVRGGESRMVSTEPHSIQAAFELDESDVVWNSTATTLSSSSLAHQQQSSSSSLSVNIPNWSKIFRTDDYYKKQQQHDDDDDEKGFRIPPHELVAKKQMARNGNTTPSFSVHEGLGRTLKGRDMSRMRNAIWAKTGFQD